MIPIQIKVIEAKKLFIKWNDGKKSVIELNKLRRLCPCATCNALREGQSKTFIPLFYKDQTTVTKIEPVGNYGFSITWKDGHSTGIYEYPYLQVLSKD